MVGLISGVPTSAAPRLVLQISDLHLRRYPIRNRLVPRGAVESLTISDWSVGGSNPSMRVNFFFFFLSFNMSGSKILFFFFY